MIRTWGDELANRCFAGKCAKKGSCLWRSFSNSSFISKPQPREKLRRVTYGRSSKVKQKFVVRYAVIDASTMHSLRLTGYWPFYSDWSWRWPEHEQNGHTFRNCCRCRTFVSSKRRCRSWPQKDTR
jgi:hypothetical protein